MYKALGKVRNLFKTFVNSKLFCNLNAIHSHTIAHISLRQKDLAFHGEDGSSIIYKLSLDTSLCGNSLALNELTCSWKVTCLAENLLYNVSFFCHFGFQFDMFVDRVKLNYCQYYFLFYSILFQ